MKIIICGAGQVGRGIAERLVGEDTDLTVIDNQPHLVQSLSDSLDIQGIVGHGSHPDVLERAGAGDAEMIIAVTHADEVNMVTCEVANAIFNVPTKIARVRSQAYLRPEYRQLFSRANTAIDVVISPELAVGDMVLRRLALPGAFEANYLAEERVVALGIVLREDCPVVDTPLSQLTELFPDLNAVVVGIVRENTLFVPHGEDQMQIGDKVYVIAETGQTARALGLFGHEEKPPSRVLIAGAGNIGLYVARKLEERGSGTRVRMIEARRDRAEAVAETLRKSVILHGSALDQALLREAGVDRTEAFVALTNDDKVNVLAAMLAKQEGAELVMALVSSLDMTPLATPLGIDSFIDPKSVTVSSILTHVRRGRIRGVHPVQGGEGEIVEAEALETSPMIGVPLREAELPEGVRLGAIVRDDAVIIPRGQTIVKPHDKVIVFALKDRTRELQHLFRVTLEYF